MRRKMTRRNFVLHAAGGTVLTLGVSKTLVTPADAQITAAISLLKNSVLWLGTHVLAPAALEVFGHWLSSTDAKPAPPDNSFHGQYSPGVEFDRDFSARQMRWTEWTGYMGVQGVPRLSTSGTLRPEGDLNIAEITELRNDRNPNLWYNGVLRLAPVPNSLRMEPTPLDEEILANDVYRSGANPSTINLEYVRHFCDCSGLSLRGYGWSSVDNRAGFRIMRA
jgi:hypothetical protein